MKILKHKKILIFGGSGSLGMALINRFVEDNVLHIFSRDEAKHWSIKNKVNNDNLTFSVGDIRDKGRVSEVLRKQNADIVIIASALKQVDICEAAPFESIQTNILGIVNIIDSINIQENVLTNLKSVLMISTDKACAPVNVYGMCKAIAERIVTSNTLTNSNVNFIGVRYGNVLESRGSILPLFRHQADNSDSFTLTDSSMTRFLMTLNDSIDLIVEAICNAKSGEIWLPKIKSMRINDLAEIFSTKYNKPIKVIGIRPGEKLHEDLISESESLRVKDIGTHYILGKIDSSIIKNPQLFSYTSNDEVMNKLQLKEYLDELGILDWELSKFQGKRIDEIRMD